MDDYRKQQSERKRQERIKRAKRKNMIIYVETLLILILTVVLIVVSISYANHKDEYKGSNVSDKSVVDNSETASVDPENTLSVGGNASNNSSNDTISLNGDSMKAELDMWYMKLVNPDNSITNSYINSIDHSAINERYIVSNTKETCKYLDSRIVKYFEDMCEAAAKDGITLVSVSAFRSYSYQEGLYQNRVKRCQNEDGLSLEAAKKKAATIVAVPGTSEHHLGLAVDINSVEESFEDTEAFKWLQKNAEKYGFVMRYPKDKQDITKIIYEPWHYRFVGVEHAMAMNDLDMCMEEYVEYLKSGNKKK